jgi:hypothetical protein
MRSLCYVKPPYLLVCRAGPAWAVAGAAQRSAYKEVPLPGEQRVCGDVRQHVQGAQQQSGGSMLHGKSEIVWLWGFQQWQAGQ